MKNMKSIIIAVGCLVVLGGCFNTDTTTPTISSNGSTPSSSSKVFNNNQFAFNFPSDWDVIQPKDFTSEVPQETLVVIRNNIKNDTFTANVNVVRNTLQKDISNLDYAKEILNRQKVGLLDYKETKREIVSITIGGQAQETYFVEFEARLNATEPVTKFIQTYAVKDRAGYIIMGAHSFDEQSAVVDKLSSVIKSFKVS